MSGSGLVLIPPHWTVAQHEALLKAIKPHRVSKAQGQSHVEAYEIAAHLTRIFGFGHWSKEILELTLVHESERPNPRDKERTQYTVVYRCAMRLHVDSWWTDDVATGDGQNMPTPGDAHDFAAKTAVSQALKRCAKDLGDQMGLSLYRGGSLEPVVRTTLVWPATGIFTNTEPSIDVTAIAPAAVAEPAWEDAVDMTFDQEGATLIGVYDPDTGELLDRVPMSPQEDLGGTVPEPTPAKERIREVQQALDERTRMVANKQLAHIMGEASRVWKGMRRGEVDKLAQEFCIAHVLERHGRTIDSRTQLTMDEADEIIERLTAMQPVLGGAPGSDTGAGEGGGAQTPGEVPVPAPGAES